MLEAELIRKSIRERFDYVEELGGGVIRAERRYRNKPFAVAYIDFTDDIVERSEKLTEFQELLVGGTFFASDSNLRWNSYLYFLAGPKSKNDKRFQGARARIESDRHFARKFVVTEEEFARRLGFWTTTTQGFQAAGRDPGAEWAAMLRQGKLPVLLEQRPRTQALGLISSGIAFAIADETHTPVLIGLRDPLRAGRLRSLTIEGFRPINNGKTFSFGDVNLIIGANGTGKTSLLEAIEALYCGRVRRDSAAKATGLKANLTGTDGSEQEVEGTSSVQIIKARNLTWYGRPDPQSSAISQGFTRFNFLDTDAAFRLSSEPDPEAIREDLDKLLVGAETAKLWSYLSKLQADLASKLVSVQERLPSLRSQADLLEADVKRLREAPTHSLALRKSYVDAVNRIYLTPRSGTAHELDAKDRAEVQTLVTLLDRVISAVHATPLTLCAIADSTTKAREALNQARKLSDQHHEKLGAMATLESDQRKMQQTIDALNAWLQYCEGGVPARAAEFRELQTAITELRKKLQDVRVEGLQPPVKYAQVMLPDAVTAVRAELLSAERDHEELSSQLTLRRQVGESVASIKKELHDLSLTVIEKTGERNSCPVCGTYHTPQDLLEKIHKLLAITGGEPAEPIRRDVQISKDRVESARRDIKTVEALQSYVRHQTLFVLTSCDQLWGEITGDYRRLEELSKDRDELLSGLTNFDRMSGMKWMEVDIARAAAMQAVGDTVDLSSGAELREMIDKYTREVVEAKNKVLQLRADMVDLTKSLVEHLHALGLPIPGDLTVSNAVVLIERFLRQLEESQKVIETTRQQIHLAEDQPLEVVKDSLQQALTAFDRAFDAQLQEQTSHAELRQKSEELRQVKEVISSGEKEQENLKRGQSVLLPLVTQHSIDVATRGVMNSIRDVVSDVFARIHSPQEYEIGDFSADMFLVRREDQKPHAVDQISTGQRAALALSIFLALNISAKTAPPIVLIDDPIAHIDDLNALSFLDYLRDLVVTSSKQVFFATADARLAALFERKFEFLGDERFARIVLRH